MPKQIVIKPIITEKATKATERLNKYGFIVDKKADKNEIKAEIEKLYSVSVESVNTMNYGGGKPKMKYTTKGISWERKKAYKKAFITLAEGDVIDIYSNI